MTAAVVCQSNCGHLFTRGCNVDAPPVMYFREKEFAQW